MGKYRKKPVVIEAVRLSWNTLSEVRVFVKTDNPTAAPWATFQDSKGWPVGLDNRKGRLTMNIPTPEGVMMAKEGDWIIKGVEGEFYPCKQAIFEATYEAVGL